MIWLGFCTELITVALHYYIFNAFQKFFRAQLHSFTLMVHNCYFNEILHLQWCSFGIIMALPYQPQIIWFLPVIAIGLHRKRNNSKVFLFSFLLVKNSVSTTFKRDWYILVFSHKFRLFVVWCPLFSHDLFIFLNNASHTSTCNYFWKNTMNYL